MPEDRLTPWQNIMGYLLARGIRWREARRRTAAALVKMGLWDVRNRMTGRMSGGQRQRTLLGMAIASEADVLFLDEPTTVWIRSPGERSGPTSAVWANTARSSSRLVCWMKPSTWPIRCC